MKVLHINHGKMFGGVESVLVTLARQSSLCREMKPAFALCATGRLSDELKSAGMPVFILGDVRASRWWTIGKARRRLRALLQQEAFDAVICHMPWNHAVFGPEVKRAGTPLIFWQHGLASGSGWLERWASQTRPDLAISNSEFTATTLRFLFPDVPKHIVHCPVESNLAGADRESVRRKLGASPEQVVILQVSRIEACKGHAVHLRALAELKADPRWTCWMVGGVQQKSEQDLLAQLKAQAAELGIADRVVFAGQASNVAEILRAADIFCQPNEAAEGFGITFVEAMAAGLPVVATRLGALPEIVTDREGFLLEPGDPHSLAGSLRFLIENSEHRRTIGQNGPARAKLLCDPGTEIRKLYRYLQPLGAGSLHASVAG